jgi:hypothetical protein
MNFDESTLQLEIQQICEGRCPRRFILRCLRRGKGTKLVGFVVLGPNGQRAKILNRLYVQRSTRGKNDRATWMRIAMRPEGETT